MAGRARAHTHSNEIDRTWMKYIDCELCGKRFCCNNYEDRKPRVKRYLGHICCAFCQFNALPAIRTLLADKTIKVVKVKKKGKKKK